MKNTIKQAILSNSPFLIKEMVAYGAIVSRPIEKPLTFRDYGVSVKDPMKMRDFQNAQQEAEKEIGRMNYAIKKKAENDEKMASSVDNLGNW